MGTQGLVFWLFGAFVIRWLGLSQPANNFFFAQHVWDRHNDEHVVDQDWGKYNTWSSYSLWMDEMKWHPFFWFTNGACPATLTYHLEHTLFPGVSYYYLPIIAPLIEEVATKYGIEYPKITSYGEMRRVQMEMYAKYSVKPSTKNVKAA